MLDKDVKLIINGNEFSNFLGVSIELGIDQIADGFSFTADWDPAREDLRQILQPFQYQKCEVIIGDQKIITGRIEKISPSWSSSDRLINIQGRSLTAAIVDNPVPEKTEYLNLTLAQIANKICGFYGVKVKALNDTNPIAIAEADYGQSAAGFLQKLAAPRNILLNCDAEGALVISTGKNFGKTAPVAKLEEGMSPLLSMSSSFDGSARYRIYEAASQVSGLTVKGRAIDDDIKIDRRKYITVSDVDQDVDVTAYKCSATGLGDAVKLSGSLAGWHRDDGQLWNIKQIVNILSPSAMIYKMTPWLINKVSLNLDVRSGYTTDFEFVSPEFYSGKLPGDKAWKL